MSDYASTEHYPQNIKWDTIIWNNRHALNAWAAFLDLLWKAVDLHVPRFNTIVRAHKKNYPREIRKLITKKCCLWRKCQTNPGPHAKSQYYKCTKEFRRKYRELPRQHEKNVILSNNLGMFYKYVIVAPLALWLMRMTLLPSRTVIKLICLTCIMPLLVTVIVIVKQSFLLRLLQYM